MAIPADATASYPFERIRGRLASLPVRRAFASAWRFRWLLLMNLYLVSPVLLYECGALTPGKAGPDKLAAFAVTASICWLLLVQLVIRRVCLAHALLFPFYVLVGVDLFLIIDYGGRLTSSVLLVIIENWSQAGDYLHAQIKPTCIGLAAVAAFFALVLFKTRQLVVPKSTRMLYFTVGALVIVYGAVGVKQAWSFGMVGGMFDVMGHDRNSPFGIFPQAVIALKLHRDSLEHARRAASFSFGATRAATPPEAEQYVLVVGESSRPDHWSLYGYGRETNPRLSKEENLVVYRDVVTSAALTQIAVPLILTRGSAADLDRTEREKSIISAFREVGFATYWLSTQQRDVWSGAVNRYSAEADHERYFERVFDGVLLDEFRRVLGKSHDRNRKVFIVLHTQGSHFTYADRYPSEAARFSSASGDRSDHQRLIDEYDDSIVYTDYILAELVDMLRGWGGVASLLYVSDHGENLRDDERELFGHFLNNEYDLPVPMVLWYSDGFARRYPAKVASARLHAGGRLSTRAVFFTLAEMAEIQFPDMPTEQLSLLSPRMIDAPRLVLQRWKPVDYDEWVRTAGVKTLPLSR